MKTSITKQINLSTYKLFKMRTYLIPILSLFILVSSCNQNAEVSTDIQELQTQKEDLKNQIDSLSKTLKKVEKQIASN